MLRQGQSRRKAIPDRLQLAECRVQLGRKFHVHTGPHGVGGQLLGLGLPLGHIALQTSQTGLRFSNRLGRKHFDALRQQHGRFALNHDLVLQILDAFDDFSQAGLQAGQRFA